MGVAAQREVLAPLPAGELVPATELRGTMLTTSLALVKENNLEARYWSLLPEALHGQVRRASPSTWVPLDVALAHYSVLDRLFPLPSQQILNGRLSSERTQSAYLRTLFKLASSSGQLNPAVALRKLPAAIGRMWNGGGAPTAYRTGPKDARIELFAYPIIESTYVRNAWQGMFESALSLTARRVYVRLDSSFNSHGCVAYDVSWV